MTNVIKKIFCSIIPLLTVIAGQPVHGQWYGENVDSGADIIMMDIRWPWWSESTYSANFNIATIPGGVSAYGGFAGSVETVGDDHRPNLDPEVQSAFRPGSVWSFWGSNDDGEPVRVVSASEHTYAYQYIGEGASGALFGTWPDIRQNHWYTMVMRIWKSPNPQEPNRSYMGRWVKDVEANRWYLYGIMKLPIAATAFTGNAGFLEDFGHSGRSARSIHRRRGYFRKDQQWHPSSTVTINVYPEGRAVDDHWIVNKIENGTALAMEVSQNRKLVPQLLVGEPLAYGKEHSFKVNQPALPTLDQPTFSNLQATSNGKQIRVSWNVPTTAAPQMGYRIEVFDNPDCQGVPASVVTDQMPITRHVLIPTLVSNPTIRFWLTDLFDQTSEPTVLPITAAQPPTPAIVPNDAQDLAGIERGLRYELWAKDETRQVNVIYPPSKTAVLSRDEKHYWVSLDELTTGKLIQRGISRGLDLELRGKRREGYGFRFDGLLRVPATGFYLIHMRGTDGYRISIDGQQSLQWDGLHGPQPKTTALHLAKGDHSLHLDYFVDRNKPFFQLEWEGPGLPRQDIPAKALFHHPESSLPIATIQVATEASGKVDAKIVTDPKGHQIEKIDFFFDTMQISSAAGTKLDYSGVLPAGEHQLWARIYYDGILTIDTPVQPIIIANQSLDHWNLGIAGEKNLSYNILQPARDQFSFVGEGEYVVTRPVDGDFTLTCKVEQCAGTQGEPVNGNSWVGLSVREHPEKNNYGWGQEFGVMQVAHNGVRTTPDHGDGAGTRQSYQKLPDGHPWLRIVRHGNSWTAWTSSDGKIWDFGSLHYKRIGPKVGAGVVFRALPQDAQMFFRATVSHATLSEGIPDDYRLPVTPADDMESATLTGVVVSPSDANTIALRTSNRGILISNDGGKQWREANGSLKDGANIVRSIAFHPDDPQTILRATNAGLFRSVNGGQTWIRLPVDCNFDGLGPSAICGEVIAFIPGAPTTLLAAGESEGLFRSVDSGQTWTQVIDAGHRFTALDANQFFRNQFGHTVIHAVTCPDRFMSYLGRGQPTVSTPQQNSFDLVSFNNGETFQSHAEQTDIGYFNSRSMRCSQHVQLYGTTHGLIHTVSLGQDNCLYGKSLPLEALRPMTAIGVSVALPQFCSRKLVQVLAPSQHNRLSRSDLGGDVWSWVNCTGDVPQRVLSIKAADASPYSKGNHWWVLGDDGLYRSDDNCKTIRRILLPHPDK